MCSLFLPWIWLSCDGAKLAWLPKTKIITLALVRFWYFGISAKQDYFFKKFFSESLSILNNVSCPDLRQFNLLPYTSGSTPLLKLSTTLNPALFSAIINLFHMVHAYITIANPQIQSNASSTSQLLITTSMITWRALKQGSSRQAPSMSDHPLGLVIYW